MDILTVKNIVHEPTCCVANTPRLIDVIITNWSQKFAKTITCNTSLSDYHYMVVSVLKKHAPCIKNREVRIYKPLNADAFMRDVDQIPLVYVTFSIVLMTDAEYRKILRKKAACWHAYLKV